MHIDLTPNGKKWSDSQKEDIKKSTVLILIAVCISCLATIYLVGVEHGKEKGMRTMAKHIQEIRRLERINALAPKLDK